MGWEGWHGRVDWTAREAGRSTRGKTRAGHERLTQKMRESTSEIREVSSLMRRRAFSHSQIEGKNNTFAQTLEMSTLLRATERADACKHTCDELSLFAPRRIHGGE